MARIKHTKNELKTQRDAQRRYQRYLPTLLLKKQQLQMEMRNLEQRMREKKEAEDKVRHHLSPWVKMFCEPFDFPAHLQIKQKVLGRGNIAGVQIPVLEKIEFEDTVPDLHETPPWVDDGLWTLKELIQLRAELSVMEEQLDLLADELRTTSQRVNLFEKVKIPEAKEHIRVIQIFLGDQQTAAVARAKLAKGKAMKRDGAA